MSDRLAELVRQRALVQEHLAWLDREIAQISSQAPSPTTTSTTSASVPSEPHAKSNASSATEAPLAQAEEILEQYRTPPASVHSEVRKGCFLYFAVAFVLLGVAVAILYVTVGSR